MYLGNQSCENSDMITSQGLMSPQSGIQNLPLVQSSHSKTSMIH